MYLQVPYDPNDSRRSPKISLRATGTIELLIMETGRAMREASLEEKDTSLFLRELVLKYSLAFQNGKSSRQMYTLSVFEDHYAENMCLEISNYT